MITVRLHKDCPNIRNKCNSKINKYFRLICSNCLDGTNLSNQKHVKEYKKNKNKKLFLNDVFEICHPNVQEGLTD